MNIAKRSILLAPLLMYLLFVNASASTSSAADSLSNRAILSQPRDQRFRFLSALQTQHSVSDTGADSITNMSVAVPGLKDPSKAFFYALVPGSVVHGAGHLYAGKTATGFLLLGTELVGAALIVGGTLTGWGRSSPTREGFAVAFAGGTLFFGSWIYDMIKSPLIVEKQNRPLEKKSVGIEFGMEDREPRLAVVWRF